MRWSDLTQSAPRLAELGRARMEEPGVVLVGTVRRDGSPRISPVEPLLWREDLWLSMLLRSAKARDLLRDPRILVHSVVAGRDGGAGELKLRGRAVEEPEGQPAYAEAVAARLGWRPVPGRFHLFRVDLDDVTFIRYDEPTGDQFVTRWPAGEEYVRRGTSATSLGEREPRRDLLG
ncbi:MAG: pyridoxamine 5'-phosphate oxidase family protein [Nocardioides sp.]